MLMTITQGLTREYVRTRSTKKVTGHRSQVTGPKNQKTKKLLIEHNVALLPVALFISLLICAPANAQQKTGLILKERLIEDSFKDILKENEQLKTEKAILTERLNKVTNRLSLYSGRIKNSQTRIEDLNNTLTATHQKAMAEKEELEQEITQANEEKQTLNYIVSAMEYEKETDDYYKMYVATKEMLESLKLQAEQDRLTAQAEIASLTRKQAELQSENGALHYNLGNLFFEKGEYTLAAREYEHALTFIPNDPDLYYNLAIVYDYHIKDPDQAKKFYNKYLQLSGSPKNAYKVKERIADNDLRAKYQEAIQ